MIKNLCGAILIASTLFLATSPKAEEVKYNLEELIKKALDNSPSLQASRSQALASEGDLKQASAYNNPEIMIEAENVVGTGQYSGFKSAETTYGVSQKLTRPNRYSARVSAAEQGVKVNYSLNDIAQLDLIKNVKIAYANAVAASVNYNIARDQKELAEKTLSNVTKRVEAAASPLYQKSKAEVLLSTSSIEMQKANQELAQAKINLASLWGEPAQQFEVMQDGFNEISDLSFSEQDILNVIEIMPDASMMSALESQARFNYDLEKANALDDPTVSLGMRDFRDSNDQAFIASFSFPIPVFDQNRGNILKAQNQATYAKQTKQAKLVELKSMAITSFRQMKLAFDQVNELKTKVIPLAENAFKQTRMGYDKGKFPYLEVLDAQRTLFDAKFSLNNALKEYHIRRAEVERFLPVETINQR